MIYLDNAATTKISKKAQLERDMIEDNLFANTRALHSYGMEAENIVISAKETIAKTINASKDEIFFTKGATESNNIVIASFASSDNIAITTSIEHSSVYESFRNNDFKEVIEVKNDSYGFLDLGDLKNKLTDEVKLISIIHVSNELGTIQDIKAITDIVRNYNPNIFIHIDATQSLGKVPIDVKSMDIDAMSFSAHKIHGPKGIGGLYIKKVSIGKLKPILHGGSQQIISSGTDNHPAIAAMATALDEIEKDKDYTYVKELNDYLRKLIDENISDYHFNSPIENASPYILSVAFKNIKSEVLLHMLEEEEIYVSSGSACSLGDINRILEAVRLDPSYRDGVIRFSFSSFNTKDELDYLIEVLKRSIEIIRKVMK